MKISKQFGFRAVSLALQLRLQMSTSINFARVLANLSKVQEVQNVHHKIKSLGSKAEEVVEVI
jgi:hypothetical protein